MNSPFTQNPIPNVPGTTEPELFAAPNGKAFAAPLDPQERQVFLTQLAEEWDRWDAAQAAGKAMGEARVRDFGPPSKLEAGLREFGVNALMGIPDYISAAATGIPGAVRDPESAAALDGLDFWQRRDASRAARDTTREASGLSRRADNLWSLAGVIGSLPLLGGGGGVVRAGTSVPGRLAGATRAGAIEGAISGVGDSDAQSLPGLFEDAAMGAGVGAGFGTALQGGAEGIAATTRGMYARAPGDPRGSSLEAYNRQTELGLRPTPGSIGNEAASSLEQSLAQMPFNPSSAVASAISRIPGAGRWYSARQGLQENLGRPEQWVIDETQAYLANPGARTQNIAEFNAQTQGGLEGASAGLSAERNALGQQLDQVVPPGSPTPVTPVEAVPGDLRAQYRGADLISDARSEVSRLNKNPRVGAVYSGLDQQLRAQMATIQYDLWQRGQQLSAIQNYRAAITDPVVGAQLDRQIASMQAGIQTVQGDLQRVQGQWLDNQGVAFQAARDWRSGIGSRLEHSAGLDAGVKKQLYRAGSDALEQGAEAYGGKAARDEVARVNRDFKANYADDQIVQDFLTKGPTQNYPKLERAFLKGDTETLRALEARMSPDDWGNVRGNIIHHFGAKPNDPTGFDLTRFKQKWEALSPDGKAILAPDPESRAVLDSLAAIADDVQAQLSARNHSRTAVQGSVFGSLAVKAGTFIKFAARMTATDLAFASDMTTKAIAGKPDELQAFLRRALLTEVTRGDEPREEEMRDTVKNWAGDATRALTGGNP